MPDVKVVNIKFDMPGSDDAIRRVTYNIRNSKVLGTRAIKFIHGYGSTGAGGVIRTKTRRYLSEQKRKDLIKDFITGEDFSIFNEATRRALNLCPELRDDPDLDRHNNGVTIVIL
jgi:hypothetical protein